MWFSDLNMYLEKRLLGKLMQTVSVSPHVRPMWWSNYWDGDAIPPIQVSVLWCWEHIALFLLQVWVRVSMSSSPATLFYWIVVPLRCQSGTTGISSWIGKGGHVLVHRAFFFRLWWCHREMGHDDVWLLPWRALALHSRGAKLESSGNRKLWSASVRLFESQVGS